MRIELRGLSFACCLLLCWAMPAWAKKYTVASTVTTAMLAEECGPTSQNLVADFCTGYVLATFDAMSAKRLICPAIGVTTQQTIFVGRKYLNDHPEQWNLSPSFVVGLAFQAAYPCDAN